MIKTADETNRQERASNSFDIKRQAVPDCTQLQINIINEAKKITQSTSIKNNRVVFNLSKRQVNGIYQRFVDRAIRFQPLAITIAIFSLIIVFSPNQVIHTSSNLIDPIDQTTWEELWLMQDELAFAEL